MRDPRFNIVNMFAACGILIALSTIFGLAFIGEDSNLGRWHNNLPGMALPTATLTLDTSNFSRLNIGSLNATVWNHIVLGY